MGCGCSANAIGLDRLDSVINEVDIEAETLLAMLAEQTNITEHQCEVEDIEFKKINLIREVLIGEIKRIESGERSKHSYFFMSKTLLPEYNKCMFGLLFVFNDFVLDRSEINDLK